MIYYVIFLSQLFFYFRQSLYDPLSSLSYLEAQFFPDFVWLRSYCTCRQLLLFISELKNGFISGLIDVVVHPVNLEVLIEFHRRPVLLLWEHTFEALKHHRDEALLVFEEFW